MPLSPPDRQVSVDKVVVDDDNYDEWVSGPQIRLKNQISQRSVTMIRRSGIFQIISDLLSEVQRTDPR